MEIDGETTVALPLPQAQADEPPTLERSTRVALVFFAFAGLGAPVAVAVAITVY